MVSHVFYILSHFLCAFQKENIKTIPNLLTTLRMASAPLLGYLVVCESFGWALSLFAVAGITDMVSYVHLIIYS